LAPVLCVEGEEREHRFTAVIQIVDWFIITDLLCLTGENKTFHWTYLTVFFFSVDHASNSNSTAKYPIYLQPSNENDVDFNKNKGSK